MSLNDPWQRYRQVATQTAPPGHLVVMLYDGIIRFLENARLGFQHEDPLEFNQTVNNNLVRAQAIINELNYSLDLAQGGDFAVRMRELYLYMDRRLQESNVQKTIQGIEEVLRHVTVLRDAWSEVTTRQPGDTNAAGGEAMDMAGRFVCEMA